MDRTIANINAYFAEAKRAAKPKLKPFVSKMHKISVDRAKNLITDAQANVKMRNCCLANGINPQVIDGAYFEAQSIKTMAVGPSAFDFNPKKKGKQAYPEFKFKSVGVDFNGKKPNRKSTPKVNLPNFDFKPVNLFENKKAMKTALPNFDFKPVNLFEKKNAPRGKIKTPKLNIPNFNIKMPKQEHKKHQGRFEAVDLLPGPKGSKEIFIGPVFPKKGKKKKNKVGLPKLNLDFRGLF